MKSLHQDKTIIGLLLSYFLLIALGALTYPEDARLFPMLISIPAIFLSVFLLCESRKKKCADKRLKGENEGATNEENRRHAMAFLIAPAYIITVSLIGYALGTLLLLFIVPWLLGYRHRFRLILFSIAFVFIIWMLFEKFLLTPIPSGLLFPG